MCFILIVSSNQSIYEATGSFKKNPAGHTIPILLGRIEKVANLVTTQLSSNCTKLKVAASTLRAALDPGVHIDAEKAKAKLMPRLEGHCKSDKPLLHQPRQLQ